MDNVGTTTMATIAAAPAATVAVQVCHAASPQQITLIALEVAAGATVEQAIHQSGLLEQVMELDLAACRVGIWGKLKLFETVVKVGDRIEVYRPLIADPKDARRRRAAKAKS